MKELDAAYEKVSNMYDAILNDESFKITENQKKHLLELKGNSNRERQILSAIKIDETSALPTYREALYNGKLAMIQENEKTRYEEKEKSLQNIKEKFDNLTKDGHKNSKEYREMIKSAERLRRIMEAVSNPEKWKELNVDPVPNEYETQELLKKFESAATQAAINNKSSDRLTNSRANLCKI